jgi:hypothetical protein
MMEKDMGAIPGSREPDPASGSGPSGFDPSRIAAQLRPFERAALKGEKVGGSTKPNLVKRGLMWLKPRVQAEGALPRYEYTLTETGRLVVEAIATEAEAKDRNDG